jgi:anti-anti-sigma factor
MRLNVHEGRIRGRHSGQYEGARAMAAVTQAQSVGEFETVHECGSANGCHAVRVGSRLDVTSVSEVRRELHAALDASPCDLHVDLSDVTVLDAAGLGMLVAAHRKATLAGQRLVLTGVPPSVGRVLAVTRLYRVFRLDRQAVAGGALVPAPAR